MSKYLYSLIVASLAILILPIGCSSATPTNYPNLPTLSYSPTPSSIVLAETPTLPPTTTPIPISTITLVPTATKTPLPTLAPTQAVGQVMSLFQNNGGCRLPCWWGLVPGKTRWEDARDFLMPFAEISRPFNLNYLTSVIDLDFQVPPSVDPNPLVNHFTVHDGLIEEIDTDIIPTTIPTYALPAFLRAYGQPEEVWINAYASAPGDLPFRLILFYPHQGILIQYGMEGVVKGEKVVGCPTQAESYILLLWSPSQVLTFQEKSQTTSHLQLQILHSLTEATGLTIADFYQTFSIADNTSCLETLASLWQ